MLKKYYLKNIKVENKSIIGDCPICGHQHIGFNYGGNSSSYPIGCGWAGSFQMSCPGCGSIFGHGGHEMPIDAEKALCMLEPNDVLEKRMLKVQECQDYLASFEKEEDLEYKHKFEEYRKRIVSEIDSCLNTYNDKHHGELSHFYYRDHRYHTRFSSDCISDTIKKLGIDKIDDEELFLEAINNSKEVIREEAVNNIENERRDIFYLVKKIGNYKLLYHEQYNEIKVFNTLNYDTINLSFLIAHGNSYMDDYATGLEGVVGIKNIEHLQFVESVVRELVEIENTKRGIFCPTPQIESIAKAKDIAEYHIYKRRVAELEKQYSKEELDTIILYNTETLDRLDELVTNKLK